MRAEVLCVPIVCVCAAHVCVCGGPGRVCTGWKMGNGEKMGNGVFFLDRLCV